MKCLPLLMLGSAILLGGCASDFSAPQKSAAAGGGGEESYVSLGSNIPKKGAKRSADQSAADLQQLENARAMGNANMSGQ